MCQIFALTRLLKDTPTDVGVVLIQYADFYILHALYNVVLQFRPAARRLPLPCQIVSEFDDLYTVGKLRMPPIQNCINCAHCSLQLHTNACISPKIP